MGPAGRGFFVLGGSVKVQVSLARILIGDNVAPFTYTDAEILLLVNRDLNGATMSAPDKAFVAAQPIGVRLGAAAAFRRFPVGV